VAELSTQQAGLAIDYAASFLLTVFGEKMDTLGYEPDREIYSAIAADLFSYMLSRDFQITRVLQPSIPIEKLQ